MDEQDMDVIERVEPIDVDGPDADPRRGQTRRGRNRADEVWAQAEAARARAAVRAEELQQQVTQVPVRVFTGFVGVLPVQTREHLRQSARESVLVVTSFVDAVGGAALLAVDRLYADPRTAQEKATPRRIVIERDDEPGSPS